MSSTDSLSILEDFFHKLPDHTPIGVDLDGTLVKGDCSFRVLRQLSWLQRMPYLLYGLGSAKLKASLKKRLYAQKIKPLNFTDLFNDCLVQSLKKQASRLPLYLVTGAPQALAEDVLSKLPWFREAIGSQTTNLIGPAKAHYLKERFPQGFAYIGNSFQDIPVWKEAAYGLALPSKRLLQVWLHHWLRLPHLQIIPPRTLLPQTSQRTPS